MKTNRLAIIGCALALLVSTNMRLHGQTGDTPYAVVDRGANYRVWERTQSEYSVSGDVVPRKHRYTELATGMNYQDAAGQWVESEAIIQPQAAGGAAAVQGQHQVYFPYDIYQGTIQLVTPEGKHMRSRPLGLSYDDGVHTVLIAELKGSVGQLVGSNQVIYPEAFRDLKADVRYTYTKAGFEQDIVLREQPPTPESLGLNPKTARLQVLTEFFDTQEPKAVKHQGHGNQGNNSQVGGQADLTDTSLDFGGMEMGSGQAFTVEDSLRIKEAAGSYRAAHHGKGHPVYKTWLHLKGRTFLIEELAFKDIQPELQNLSGTGAQSKLKKSLHLKATAKRVLPASRPVVEAGAKSLPLASADLNRQAGVVLDYNLIDNAKTDFTFQGDTTYYVSGEYNLGGTTTFEGGTVIKMNYDGQIDIIGDGSINCKTGPYRPAVWTSVNDDTVGEEIDVSSHNPAVGDAGNFLFVCYETMLNDMRFSYANLAVDQMEGTYPYDWIDMSNCQFVNVGTGVLAWDVRLHNVLFVGSGSGYAVNFGGTSLTAENVTADRFSAFVKPFGGGGITLVNSLLTCQAADPGIIVSKTCTYVVSPSCFNSVGAGNYYLAGDTYRNVGTISISPALLTALRQKTTCAPEAYNDAWIDSNWYYSGNGVYETLRWKVARDTSAGHVDLGYHYDPLDYYFDGYTVLFNGTLTVTNGVQVGFGGPLYIEPGASLVSQSKADQLNRLVQCRTVQEQAVGWSDDPTLSSDAYYCSSTVNCRFTEFSRLAGPGGHVSDDYKGGAWNFQDCQFQGAQVSFIGNACALNVGLTNCLFERTKLYAGGSNMTLSAYNNLFYQGDVWLSSSDTASVFTFRDNFFYQNNLTNLTTSGTLTDDHNGYITNYNRLGTGTGDKVLTNFTFQSSWLGDYYQPTNSPLINAGSRSAADAGLYHYTTQTNQVKEANTTVDIGYHYVALNPQLSTINPVDSNGDGTPDYIADANGNGIVDTNETPWGYPPVITQHPTNQTVAQGANVTFSVTVSTNSTLPLSYQWYFNSGMLANATNATLTLTNVQTTNAGNYSVVVTNVVGSMTSSNAVLTATGPSVILSPGDLYYLVGAAPKIIDSLATVINAPGCSNFNSRTLTVSLITNAQSEDALGINNVGTNANRIGVTNNFVTYWGTNIATFSGGSGSNALVINFLSSPVVSTVMVQALLTNITYRYYPSTNKFLGTRTVQFVLNDCYGNTNYPARKNIGLTCPQSLDVMLVIDCSGSMDESLGSTNSKLSAAEAAAISFINSAMQFTNDQVGLVTFSTTATNRSGLTNNPSQVINIINGLTWDQYTDIGDGITNAQNDFPTNGVGPETLAVMILLTDGVPNRPLGTNPDPTNYCILKANLAKLAGTRLITIGLGTNGSADFNTNLLTTLASSPGDFIWATNTDALTPIYQSIGYSLCRPPTNQPPMITQQPINQTVIQGNNATFSVTATGALPLSYQWRFNTTNILMGATNASLTLTNIQTTNAGNYSVVVTNVAGSVISSNAVLTANVPPVITQQPVNVTTNVGGNATFSVVVSTNSTPPLFYQWLFNGTNIVGATNTTLTLTNVQFSQTGNYAVLVTNMVGSALSSNAVLSVSSSLSVLISSPSSNTVYVAPAAIQILAIVSNAVSSIQRVDFYAGTNWIGSDAVSSGNPYRFTWAAVPASGSNYLLTATAVDALNHTATSPGIPIHVAPPVQVEAGTCQTVVLTNSVAAVTLNGSVWGGYLTVTSLWSQAAGSANATFTNATRTNTIVTFTNAGGYLLRLVAGDVDTGSSAYDTVTISVVNNQPPVVDAGPNRIIAPGNSVFLNGSVTDDGLPLPVSLSNWWQFVSGPVSNGFGFTNAINSPGTTVTNLTVLGVYTFCLWANDGLSTSSNTMTVSVTDPSSRTYTFDADFAEGELVNVNYDDVPDQLQLNQKITPFPFVWVACSGRGTVVRIDANTGQILGEFRTAPQTVIGDDVPDNINGGPSPSRTTVDRCGNVWVCNRDDNVDTSINSNSMGSITRVGLVIGGTRGWIQTNQSGVVTNFVEDQKGEYLQPPFKYCTAVDRNHDGYIHTSAGLGNFLDWDSLKTGANDFGGVSAADDECIINYTRVHGAGARTIAIDAHNDLWVGGILNFCHDKIDGVTGQLIPNTEFQAVGGGYGGLIDGNGVLWSSRGLIRFDINRRFDMSVSPPTIIDPNYTGETTTNNYNYGISIDPNTGYIWYTTFDNGGGWVNPVKLGVINKVDFHGNLTRGIAVDDDGNVWVANSAIGDTTVSHMRTDGTFVGKVDLGCDNSGPHGVAIDSNGKVWAACFDNGTAVRIDPKRGPRMLNDMLNPAGYFLGLADLTVNLDGLGQQVSNPYNYSDMTGFVSLGATEPSGIWRVVHDSGISHQTWGVVQWDSSEPAGAGITVEVRAADDYLQLSATNNLFLQVTNGTPFTNMIGQFMEIRATFFHKLGTNATPVLYDLTVSSGTNAVIANPANFAVSDRATMFENGSHLVINVLSNDVAPAGARLTITNVSPASSGYVTIGAGVTNLIYTPNTNFFGVDRFCYTASDARGGIGRAVVTVEIGQVIPILTNGNYGPPVALDTNILVLGNSPELFISYTNLVRDTNNPQPLPLTLRSVTQPGHGYARMSSCKVFYTPDVGYFGPDSFTYTVRNAAGLNASSTVIVTVTGSPPLPIACDFETNRAFTVSNSMISLHKTDSSGNGLFAHTYTFAGIITQAVTITVTNGIYDPWITAALYGPDGNEITETSEPWESFQYVPAVTGLYAIEVTMETNAIFQNPEYYDISFQCQDVDGPLMAVLWGTDVILPNEGIDFGVTQLGQPVPAYLAITNYGTANLTISSFKFVPNSNSFTLTDTKLTNGTIIIPPACSSNLTVWFQALLSGRTNGILRLHDVYDNYDYQINLTGLANPTNMAPPRVGISNPVPSAVYVASRTWDSPGISITATSVPTAGASIFGVNFYARMTNGNNIPIGQQLVPNGGSYTGNWCGVPPGSYQLTAMAIDNSGLQTVSAAVPISVLLRSSNSPVMNVLFGTNNMPGSSTLNFGLMPTNIPNPVTLVITNTSTNTLVITNILIDTTSYFYLTNAQFPMTVAAHNSTNLTVVFQSPALTANAPKVCRDKIHINSNDEGTCDPNYDPKPNWFSLNLTATVSNVGTPPSVSLVYPASNSVFVAHTCIPLAATAIANCDDENPSGIWFVYFYASSSIGNIDVSEGYLGSDYVYSNFWADVPAGQYTLTAVAVDSDGIAAVSAPAIPITVILRPTNSPIMRVFLSQTNSLPNCFTINYGITQVGTPAAASLTISNAGNAVLSISKLTLSNTNDFSISNSYDLPLVISAGASTNLTLLYNAVNPGQAGGVLTIYDSDVASQPFYITNIGSANPANGTPPTVQLTTPIYGTQYTFPADITVTAYACCATNSTLANINFFIGSPTGSVSIGQISAPPGQTNLIGITTWSRPAPGTYSLYAIVTDHSGLMGQSTNVVIQVMDPNAGSTNTPGTNGPPIARDDQLRVQGVVSNVVTYPINVLANDSSQNGYPLTLTSFIYTGKLGKVAQDGNRLLFTPNPSIEGTNYIYYTISDGRGGTAAADVQIIVKMSALPAVQLVTPTDGEYIELSTVLSNRNLALVAYARGSANSITTNSVVWVKFYDQDQLIGCTTTNAGTNNIFAYIWQTPPVGPHYLAAVVLDNVGNENITPYINIEIAGNPNNHPPIAAITNLTATPFTGQGINTQIYPTITNGIVDVLGTAADNDPEDAANLEYQVLLYKADGTFVGNLTSRNTDETGYLNVPGIYSALVTNADLSIYENGTYDIQLNVFDGWVVSSAVARILLNTQLKIGQFSFSVQDLVLPVSGIPLTVTRTYNSFNLNQGDFGYSWTYAINDVNLKIDEDREMSSDIDTDERFSLRVSGGRDVTLTLPDGRRVTFQFYFGEPNGYKYPAAWHSPPGVNYKLTAFDPDVPGNIPFYDGLNRCWNRDGMTGFDSYDFPGFYLTAQDGTRYVVNREDQYDHFFASETETDFYAHTYGPATLAEIDEPGSNKIIIQPLMIQHQDPLGHPTRTITFKRDSQNRITEIFDPNSLSNNPSSIYPLIRYNYDPNSGNLVVVDKLVDRNKGTFESTFYQYTNTAFPHFLTGIIDPRGVTVARSEYDENGRLRAIYDAFGHCTQFLHDTTNHVETIIDQLGYGSTNYYDLRGNVTTTVNALGQTNRFAFDSNNYLLQSVDPLGHTNSYGYDTNGCRIATTNALGQATHFNFNGNGQLRSKTDALTNATSFDYDSAGHRTKVTDALGNPTSFGHDIYGRPTAVTNALNQLRATAGSDSSGNLQFVSQAGGLQMNFGHDLNGNTTNTSFVWVNPANTNLTQNLSTITELDAANRVTRVTDPDNNSRRTIYDSAGRVAQNIDRMGNTNSYIYDVAGNLIQTTYADGSVTRNFYDARNQVLYSDDRHLPGLAANGTHNVYDPLGRVIRSERLANVQIDITYNGGIPQSALTSTGAVLSASSTAYDAAGRVLATTNALGGPTQVVTSYEYDAVGRQTAVIDALTNRTDSVYDAGGQLRFTTNALKQVTEYQYDAKGRRIKTIFPDNSYTTNAYNEIGQLVFMIDQVTNRTDYQYDSLGRMTNIIKPLVFNPEGGTNARPQWAYQYDSYGNILVMTDPKGRQTKFTYDKFGEPVSRFLPLLQTNYQSYNALGQLDYSVDFMGQSNRFVYDSLGRVATNFLYAAGATAPGRTNVFIYDVNGRLSQTIRPEGITTFQYNLDGAATNITSPEGWIRYEYDPTMGWLTRAYTTNSDIRYGYDSLARLKTVSVVKRDGATLNTPEVTTNAYTRLGSLQDVFYPNGVHAAYQYDMMNRLTNLTYTSSASVLLSQYRYTPNANNWLLAATEILRQVNGTYATNQLAWGYDNLGRLTNEASSSTLTALNFTNKYVYDLAGNRLWKTNVVGAVTTITSYSYNANDQLLVESTGFTSFTNRYDANGSLTNRSSASEVNVYSYDLEGRLATAAINQQQTNRYYYNQSGTRTRIETSGSVNQTNVFLNDPQNLTGFNQVLEELPSVGGSPTATYTLGSQIISQEKSGTTLHLMADGHGSTRLLTDSSGVVQNAFTYDGYGSLVASNATPQTVYLYSGERFDSDLRQYYLRARYYNPTVGRFGAQDQMDGTPQDPLSLHKYAYTQNNPVNMRDPSGNEGELISMSFAMTIADIIETAMDVHMMWTAGKMLTEYATASESIDQIESQPATPGVDTATIIVHGVNGLYNGQPNGWSKQNGFQGNLGPKPTQQVGGSPSLNHDFYEFDWGGFSIASIGFIPVRIVHVMALVHLQAAEEIISMKGYANIDIISHSWGTTLSYDLMNSTDIEVHDWVTMGSPLKKTTEKPKCNTGKWINCYSLHDPAIHFEIFPPYMDWIEMLPYAAEGMRSGRQGKTGDGLTVDPNILPSFQHLNDMGKKDFDEHTAYWTDKNVLIDLRNDLQ